MKKWHWKLVFGLEVMMEFCHCLVSFHCQQKEGRGGLQCHFFVGFHHWKECWSQFWWGAFFVKQTCFPSMTPSPSLCWLIHGSVCYPYQQHHKAAIAVNSCMPLDHLSGQAPLSTISSFENWKGSRLVGRGCAGYPKLIL